MSHPSFHRFFLRTACELAHENVQNGKGGPFGALIVRYRKKEATVLGMGANHVLPAKGTPDPTAHAEVVALRNAAHHTSSFRDCVLYTSCECCPMCLAAALSAGIRTIYHAATRKDAARAGFADDAQYALMQKPLSAHATHMPDLKNKLGNNTAVVLDKNGRAIARSTMPGGATQALQAAAAKRKTVDLSDCTLLLKNAPHPFTAVAADWAKIGRTWRADAPTKHLAKKNPKAVCYIHSALEKLPEETLGADAIYHALRAKKTSAIRIEKITEDLAQCAFEAWRKKISGGKAKTY